MKNVHDLDDDNPLDFFIPGPYIPYQTIGRGDRRRPQRQRLDSMEGVTMATSGQTIAWGTPASRRTSAGKWRQRVGQWFAGRTARRDQASAIAVYGRWDERAEKFRPLSAESAFDQVAAQSGQAWAITMHSAVL
jgi:hypothetical protein